MIKSITVINEAGDTKEFPLENPWDSGFAITDISGLTPVKADVSYSSYASTDGGDFISARQGVRNIVITGTYLERPTISLSRLSLYKFFPVKQMVVLVIDTTDRRVYINGYVESHEPNIFTNNSTATISILCPNPFFYSAHATTLTTFSGIMEEFEFPFSNESFTEDLLSMSSIEYRVTRNIYYDGDTEYGIKINISAYGNASMIRVFNTTLGDVFSINTDKIATMTGQAFGNGDEIEVSTVRGNKYIRLIREGVITSIMNTVERNSVWFQLRPGDNTFSYTAESGATNLQFSIEHETIYGGI